VTFSVTHTPKIFALMKPSGVSSAHYLGAFKRFLGKRYEKVGHFGTLDPFACGVLLVGVGGAMRLMDMVHQELPKSYLAVGKLGIESNTGDREGEKTFFNDEDEIKKIITKEQFQEKLNQSFQGEHWQSPHAFSASKFEGKNLYEWARQGVMIEKPKVLRHIFKAEIVKWAMPYVTIRVEVSSGTYVRTLFEELAKSLGTRGYLVALIRENIGSVSLKDCMLKKNWTQPLPEISLTSILPHIPKILLNDGEIFSMRQGKVIKSQASQGFSSAQKVWVLDSNDQICGMAVAENGLVTSHINFIR
jgi:tRNA pseudouridine55 synthase